MTTVVDASVACKWFVPETDQALAFELLSSGERLIGPELVIAELCNIFWRKTRLGLFTAAQADAAAALIPTLYAAFAPCAPLGRRAMAISAALDHPAYDCFYIALAEDVGAEVVTADKRLLSVVRRTPWAARMRSLRP